MKIGIYGGSFNPIHFGHIGLAVWTLTHSDLDELWLMVTPSNPLKDADRLHANEQQRLQAARSVIEQVNGQYALELKDKRLRVSDLEFHLPRPSYTAQTLRTLMQQYPEHTFTLVIGEDNWQLFTRWREWEWILQHVPVMVYPRHASSMNDHSSLTINHSPQRSDNTNVTFLKEAPYFDISSTQIRAEKEKTP